MVDWLLSSWNSLILLTMLDTQIQIGGQGVRGIEQSPPLPSFFFTPPPLTLPYSLAICSGEHCQLSYWIWAKFGHQIEFLTFLAVSCVVSPLLGEFCHCQVIVNESLCRMESEKKRLDPNMGQSLPRPFGAAADCCILSGTTEL